MRTLLLVFLFVALAFANVSQLADEVSEFITESDTTSINACALQYALKQQGKCYSQDANKRMGPSCFDCSGLVYMAYKNCGKSGLPTWTGAYPAGLRSVPVSQMQPGDILWRKGHVALYAGNNQIIHALSTKWGVKLTALSSSWFGGSVQKVYRP